MREVISGRGSVAEWSKALVLGTSLNEAWVRIPPLPIFFFVYFMLRVTNVNNVSTFFQLKELFFLSQFSLYASFIWSLEGLLVRNTVTLKDLMYS